MQSQLSVLNGLGLTIIGKYIVMENLVVSIYIKNTFEKIIMVYLNNVNCYKWCTLGLQSLACTILHYICLKRI